MEAAAPEPEASDPRDVAAALLVGGAAALTAAGWAYGLLGPVVVGSRTSLLAVTGPTGLVRTGLLVTATALLAGRARALGRLAVIALALPAIVGMVASGLALVTGGSPAAPLQLVIDVGADVLLLAAAAIVVTVWQDGGWPALDHRTDLGGRLALAGVAVAIVARAFPPVSVGPLTARELLTPLPSMTVAWVPTLLGAVVTVAVVAAAARLRQPAARRLVLLVVGLPGVAAVAGNAIAVAVLDVDVRPTIWIGLTAAGYLAVLTGAVVTARPARQTSSATA